jgi:chaperonin GroES
MNFKPLYDRVLVKRAESDERTSGGIIVPDTAREKPIEGVVVAVGPGSFSDKSCGFNPLSVKVGDRIVFGKWSGSEVKVDHEEYVVLKESDILGVLC